MCLFQGDPWKPRLVHAKPAKVNTSGFPEGLLGKTFVALEHTSLVELKNLAHPFLSPLFAFCIQVPFEP